LPLDLSKLTDAVTKVAVLASSVASVAAERDAAKWLICPAVQAQADVDALTAQLVAAATTPAEAAGLTAVAAALAPVPVSPTLPAADPVAPAPVTPVAVGVTGVADTMAQVAAQMAASAS
jgi:hypothetical protein